MEFYFDNIGFYFFVCLALTFVIQMSFYWLVFSKLAFKRKESVETSDFEPVSIVVCARDSYESLSKLLPALLNQDYPDYEIVVVNDCSEDDTENYLKEIALREPKIKPVNIRQHLNFFQGKKFPLSVGIKSAKNDLLLLTDADCLPESDQWIRKMAQKYTSKTEVVLGYGPYSFHKGLLNTLIRFDTLHIALQYLSFALCKMPYMGVGRNLSYRKSTFYRNNGFISHYKIRSGDDDLFISEVANRSNTEICISREARMVSEPKTTWGEWIHQKRRHYSTGLMYKAKTKLMLGAYSCSQILFYVCLIALPFVSPAFAVASSPLVYPISIIGMFVLRYVSQLVIISRTAKQLGEEKMHIGFVPLYELFFILFTPILGVSSQLFRPKKW